ncbi:unnamed protein product [Caretta caretta]
MCNESRSLKDNQSETNKNSVRSRRLKGTTYINNLSEIHKLLVFQELLMQKAEKKEDCLAEASILALQC